MEIAEILLQLLKRLPLRQIVRVLLEVANSHVPVLPMDVSSGVHSLILAPDPTRWGVRATLCGLAGGSSLLGAPHSTYDRPR